MDKALDEYAIRFFAMCEWSLKWDARMAREMMTVVSVPHMKEREAKRVMRIFEIAGDIMKAQATSTLTPEVEKQNIKRIRKLVGNEDGRNNSR